MKHLWTLLFAFTLVLFACGPEAPDDDEPAANDDDSASDDDDSASDDDDATSDDDDSPCPLDALIWSNPDSWPGGIPGDGDAVTIPSGTHIGLDTDTAALGGLAIEGVLTFCAQDLALQADWISVSGELRIGTEADPFINQAIITLTGVPDGETPTRGIMAVGGSLEFHGAPPATAWTKINEHANTGDTALVLDAALDWSIDDQIVVAPTDFYGIAESELHQLTAVAGSEVQLDGAMQGFRWGVLQYATDAGISLTPDPSFEPPVPDDGTSQTPTVLDERAEVGNLTRNIVIQSIEDSYWLNEGFGAHVMIMTLDSTAHVDGVEFRRVGQAGELGRYPFHWHGLSYSEAGELLGDATGHYLRNSTIHDSQNRCVTIHATNGVQVQNNICYDILGHAIYFEDGVERRNLVENNLVLGVRFPDQQNALKLHETGQQLGINTGASGLWASNPDNTIINNTFADAEGFGLWMAFQPEPGEASANVAMLPNRLEFGNFDGNTMHSNQGRGVMFDNVEVDAAGNVEARAYFSTSDGLDDPTFQNLLTFTIRGWTLWKNSSGNFWNRTYGPTYEEFVSADGASKFFAGSGADGVITRCLLVGHSLNDLSPLPFAHVGPTAAFATYHSTFAIQDNIVMHFPHVEGLTSGVFASDDYYFRPVEKGHIQNLNNRLIDAHPGHRSDAAILEPLADAFALGFDFFVFAGAVWDPQGIWGAPESWNVYDRPFFTHNAACSVIAPSSQGAASCDGEYYGVDEFILDAGNLSYEDYMAISVDRLDGVDPSIVVDTWEVSEAQPNWILAHMRHFAARQNGMFLLDFPGVAVPADVSVRMTNLEEASDSVVLGVRFSGTEAAQVYSSTYGEFYNNAHATSPSSTIKHDYTAVGSREEVVASMGETYWQDTANNTVWIKVASGDIQQAYVSDYDANNPVSEVNLYNEFRLRIWIAPDLPITGGNFEDDFAGDGPLLGYTTNNPDSLPEIARVGGRYRANLTDNTANITLHFHDDQGRLDAKLLTFPFEVIARNIGIGTQADSQVAPPSDNNPYLFAGVQVHVPDLESRNSTHVVVGHRGGAENTVEGKNTVNGSSSVNDDGTNIVPDGRADIRIVGNADHTLTVYWQVPNLDPANQADNWESYGADGSLPLPAPTYGDQVYVGLITYAYNSAGVPFVGTCDGLEGGSL